MGAPAAFTFGSFAHFAHVPRIARSARRTLLRLSALLLLLTAAAAAQTPRSPPNNLVLGPYEQPDGAITVFPDGVTVEPYFAMRALLAGASLGLNVQPAADRFIQWQAVHVGHTPAFARYCRQPPGEWRVCGAADADDVALALWIDLLFTTAGRSALSPERRHNVLAAAAALGGLFDSHNGVYLVSRTLRVSLFMDNVEIARAFDDVAQAQDARRQHRAAAAWRARSARLRRAIDRVFWDAATRTYRITTQQRPAAPRAFYPDVVAEGYPSFFGYGSPSEAPATLFARWMARYGSGWLGARDHEFPWGLIAMAAGQYGDRATVGCWLGAAISLRHGPRWNVAEEAVLQGLMPSVGQGGAVPPCER